ncbi:histidine kinase [Brachybacterium horti]
MRLIQRPARAPYAVPMAYPHPDDAPSSRSSREWAIAAAQTIVCLVLGIALWFISTGLTLTEYQNAPPLALRTFTLGELVVGLPIALVIGPLRFLRPGRLHTVLHIVLAVVGSAGTLGLPAATLALVRIGRRRQLAPDAVVLALLCALGVALAALDHAMRSTAGTRVDALLPIVVMALAAIPLLVGHTLATRQILVASLGRQAVAAQKAREAAEREAGALRRERDAEIERVRAEERAALARDMHDSISHQLATIAMHAGALTYREDLSPAQVRSAAGTVRDAAQVANQELKEVLLALRSAEGAVPLPTAPTLDEIVDLARESGQDVTLTWDGVTPAELAARSRGTVVAMARILSEAVANAAKHSPGAPVAASLTRTGHRLVLHVRNPLPGPPEEPHEAPSTGHGLIGIQERARLRGGDATTRREQDSFEMEAWVPW